MKKSSTKILLLMVLALTLGTMAPAIAQTWTAKVLGTNLGVSAACKDAAGNIYVVETVATAQNQTQQNAQVVKFAAGTSTPTILTGTTFQYSEYESILNFSFGIGVDGSGNIFVTTYNDYFPSDGRDVTTYGDILKFTPAGGNAYTKSTWVTGQYPSGNKIGDFGALVIDSHNNIFVDTYNDVDGKYEIIEYPSGSTTPTIIYTHIGDGQLASGDNYSAFTTLAIDPSDNLYAGTNFSTSGGADGGKLYKLTKASNYVTVTLFGTNLYCTALACDASGALYGSIGVQSSGPPYTITSPKIVKFSSDLSSTTPLYTGVSIGAYMPWGLVLPNATTIFAGAGSGAGGSDLGDLVQLFGTPATPASNVTFSSITATTATVSWTNGGGSARVVFIKNSNTGQPVPVDATTYTASTTFGSGTQIGATNWYCIYNGTGTSVNITGLTQGQNYQVMVVEYNGAAGSENYLQTSVTNNPNTFITVSPTTINSVNTIGSNVTNASSVNFSAVFSSAVTGVSASNFSVTATGVSGVSNANIGTPTTSDNITWTVPVSTGTGNGTIQLSLANASGMSKTIGTSLPFAGQTYTIDKAGPTATIVIADASLKAGETSLVTITFSEAVTGFTNADLAIANGTLTAVSSSDGGITWTATFTPTAGTTDATNVITLDNTGVADVVGNAGSGTTNSNNYAIDNTRPTATIVVADNSLTIGETSLVTITFSEAVTGFTNADLTVANGTLTAISSGDGGITWTTTFTPTASIADATNVITLNNTGIADLADNAGSGTTNSNNYAIDTQTPTITLLPATLPAATVGTSYSQSVTASGGTTPYTYAVTAGALPAGLSLSASTGAITGTPTAGGSFNFTITATDGLTITGSQAYTLTINAPTITLAPTTLPNANSLIAYSRTLSATGGTAPYTYTVTSGALPPGITLTAITLSGTATQLGTFNFTITATDGSTGTGPYTGSRAYTLNVTGPILTLSPSTFTAATVGTHYGQSLTTSRNIVTGGETYTYAVTAGALPAGLTLTSAGFLSGTPTEDGTFNFTITSTDNATGAGPYSGSKAYTWTVNTPTIIVNPFSLPNANPVFAYDQTLNSSGGTAPYTYALTAGAFPAGLTLTSDGKISGTPTVTGTTFTFSLTSTDSSTGTGPFTKTNIYTISSTGPIPTVSPTSLVSGIQVGVPYSQTFTALGSFNTPPYTFTRTGGGSLPPGLTLSADGILSGTPTAVGSFVFQIRATDSSPGPGPYSGSKLYAGFKVIAPTIVVGPATLPVGTAGVAYSQNITATGGTAPYTYAVTTGALPAGLTLSSAGLLTGTSNITGTFNFTITATDSSTGTGVPFTASTAYTLNLVAPTLTLAPATLPGGTFGTAYSQTVSASGGAAPYTYAITTGALPAGVVLSSTGTLSGTPAAAGTFNFTVTATDASTGSGPYTASTAYSIVVVKANQTITFADITATYGDAPITLTGTASSGLGITYSSSNPSVASVSGTTLTILSAGTATITASQGGNANNNTATDVAKTLTVNAKALTITATGPVKTYGTALTVGTSATGFIAGATVTGQTVTSVTLTPDAAGLSAATAAGASYTVTPSAATGTGGFLVSNYNITYVPFTGTVVKGTLDIAANIANKTYGHTLTGAAGSTDFTSTGLQNAETIGSVTLTYGTGAAATAAVNTYTGQITPSAATGGTFTAANYNIVYHNNDIVVGKASLTITAANKNKVYGDVLTNVTGSAEFISSGLQNGETVGMVNLAYGTGAAADAVANTYTVQITPSNAAGGTFNAGNYTIAYANGNIVVGAKAIAITANAETKVYGTTDPVLTYQVTSGSLVGTDAFTGALTRDAGEAVNTYAIKQGTLALNSNYVLSYLGANLTITQANLTVKANDQTKAYNAANPILTVSYTGFVNGDTEASLTIKPTVNTTATATSPVGTYPLTASGAASPNYAVSYSPGTLTITQAVLTVTADNKTRNYGAANPEFTITYSGFLNGDDAGKLTTAPVAVSNNTATTIPGNYPITVSGGVSADYTLKYVPGTLTILPLTNADLISLTTSSGSLSPAFDTGTLTYNVKVDNATADLTLTPIFAVTATATVNGKAVANGSLSFGVPLNVGNNLITLILTAQDGVTKKTYTLNVYRGIAPTSITSNNILTPNGDGKNDFWVVKDIQLYPNNSVTVYDSGGREVFRKKGYNNDWGGTLNDVGTPLAGGTYFYLVDLGIGENAIRGYISIIRSR